jgi:hypothetical protein
MGKRCRTQVDQVLGIKKRIGKGDPKVPWEGEARWTMGHHLGRQLVWSGGVQMESGHNDLDVLEETQWEAWNGGTAL